MKSTYSNDYQKLRVKIEQDLLRQLGVNKTIGAQYLDLVSDYMALWDVKNMLIDDITDRGAVVYWCNGGGQDGYKKNDSVSELNKTNAQMLKLLAELGLKATEIKVDEDDDEL